MWWMAYINHDYVCIAGVLVSAYALYVEVRKKRDSTYVAACDFGDNMQCSKVLTSEYSQGFGVVQYLVGKDSYLNLPNCVTGIFFYLLMMFLAGFSEQAWAARLMLALACLSCLMSLYLAYILLAVLHDVCLVCFATYLINALLFLTSRQHYVAALG